MLTRDFLRDNPKTARHFVEATAEAIEWARSIAREQVVQRMVAIIGRRGRSEDALAVKSGGAPGWRVRAG